MTIHQHFFDGASVEGCCGSGMVLMINKKHILKLWMGSGKGSNTMVELLRLWGFLHFATQNGIVSLKIYGDSKVII